MQIIALNTTTSPVHAHDCDKCVYLGTSTFYNKTFDIWTCNKAIGATIVCRWSSEGWDYFSAPVKVAGLLTTDPLYKHALSLYNQWDQYMEDMGYNDVRCPLCGDPTCGGWCA